MAAGSTEVLRYAVISIGLVASATDLARGKIYNWLTIPAWFIGLVFSSWVDGWAGLGSGLLATGIAFALYGWMFWIGMMGAGDVKLLMALGAWGGAEYVARTGLLGVILGGLMAAVLLAVQGRLWVLLRKLYRFVLTLVVREM
ncbi:MAG: prepilin peptidase, partial [Bdellovibrionales bacterium]|nr:prepilin peptidase [Bdellovibrionales bacterium]